MGLSLTRPGGRRRRPAPMNLPSAWDLSARALEERRLTRLAARFGLAAEDLAGEPAGLLPPGLRAPARPPRARIASRLLLLACLAAILTLAAALWTGWRPGGERSEGRRSAPPSVSAALAAVDAPHGAAHAAEGAL